MGNKTIFSILFLFFLLLSCEKLKSQTFSNDGINDVNRLNLESKRNNIIFEFRGLKWNTPKSEIIKKEGKPEEEENVAYYFVYTDPEKYRETIIRYYNKNIIDSVNANILEYTFIDNKLMKTAYIINLPNTEEIHRVKNKNYSSLYMGEKEIFNLFYFLRSKLNELYILLEDKNAEWFFKSYKDKNEKLILSGVPIETRFGAQKTDINICLLPFNSSSIGLDTLWIKIEYEYSEYNAIKWKIMDEEKLKSEMLRKKGGL